ncbi:MAG: accessory factor UbiK family protein [Sphingomonadales bacterium]|nr:accessory factor UbiK family protein [Sphingomonadales bacterium]
MQTKNPILDDIAKLASGAAGTLHGMKGEVETALKARIDRMASEMNLVSKEEFDVVREMAQKARAENEALSARLDALEKKLAK